MEYKIIKIEYILLINETLNCSMTSTSSKQTLLSPAQQQAFDLFTQRKNIFISGQAGTGKSFIINMIYNYAQLHNKKICVTALTGCAALLLNIKATTIHSWGGIGIGGEITTLIANIRKYKKVDNWLTDILVVDEVSMMSKSLFELLDAIGKKLRKSTKPFGGIQLVFCGDFYQLPPIDDSFCFESLLWNVTFDKTILFTKNYRQQDDGFQKVLNEVREGNISPEGCKLLIECTKKKVGEGIKPTIIYPTKKLADQVNQFENLTLESEPHLYKSYKSTTVGHISLELDKQQKNIDDTITLKIGSQVMCIVNLDQDLGVVNGSQGLVIDFTEGLPIIQFKTCKMIIKPHLWKNDKYENDGIYQIPLILSWAITIHKAQGISLDEAMINIGSSVFEYGQTYVALSRVRTEEGLYIKSLDISRIKANPKVIEFYKSII
uniref:AAA+ ATPase domain-containing protein n=1 Tax=viral metagenome TaxID=1070528 RepID=A0A6C0D1I2_9ZZZZ